MVGVKQMVHLHNNNSYGKEGLPFAQSCTTYTLVVYILSIFSYSMNETLFAGVTLFFSVRMQLPIKSQLSVCVPHKDILFKVNISLLFM